MLKFKRKKVKKLQEFLESLDDFEKPNIALEQYATPPHIAANMLHIMTENTGEIDGKIVGDLGCGCGSLTLGAAVCGAAFCIGFDIDEKALNIARGNKEDEEVENVDFIQCDVRDLSNSRWYKAFDTVILNPPFGTKGNKGIDLEFLQTACSLARETVYTLHKSSTLEHVEKKVKDWNFKMKAMYRMSFNLKRTRKKDKDDSRDIEVDLIRINLTETNKML
ncbi:rRNA N6-adenosine-methyltransferase METTL5 [Nephila pilipes]|uniref:rRNA N6-adenosine-methyltransferase METTL5 n=1 Tax=Nephila pilipes TaxID=299642 RepID=A0A8X6N1R3_NEPPI|nr:rRNA N6-adenosine-methyltransferase METTL5 [Nephila pilipes]